MLIETLEHARLVKRRLEGLWMQTRLPFVSLDTETESIPLYPKKDALVWGRAQITFFSLCYRGEAYSFPTCHFQSHYPLPEDWAWVIHDWCLDQRIIKVFFNANYDINQFHYSMGIPVVKNIWDTMIGAWKASEFQEKGLKQRAPSYGRFLRETKTIDFTDLRATAHYAEQDVVQTDEMFQMQYFGSICRLKKVAELNARNHLVWSRNPLPAGSKIEIENEGLSLFDRYWVRLLELPVLRATIRAERRGFPFDLVALYKIRRRLNKDLRNCLKVIYRMVGRMINLNSNKDLTAAFDELQIDNPFKTKKGAKTFGARALQKMKGLHPFIDALVEYKGLEKMVTVYVGTKPLDDYRKADCGLEYFVNHNTGAIHCSMNTVAAVTGRNSAQNPNLQQIPTRKDKYALKTCFVPVAKGLTLSPRFKRKLAMLVWDYSQLEIRVMALFCKDKSMTKVLCDPKGDIHTHTSEQFKVSRQDAKNLNFLLLYGGQEYMLSETLSFFGVDTTVEQAAAYREKYDEVYPRVSEFRQELLEEHKARGFVKLFTGRRRTLPDIVWGNQWAEHKAETTLSNNVVQGTGQDLLKAAIVRSDWRCINPDKLMLDKINVKSDHKAYLRDKAKELEKLRRTLKLAEANFRLQIHDELVFTALPSAAEEVLKIVATIMSWRHYFPSTSEYNVPIIAEGGSGQNWKEAKSDEAKFKTKLGFDEWKKYG